MKRAAAALGVALVAASAPALAGGPIGPNGSPVTTSAYAVDLSEGPVLAGTRVTGLAGAYVAIAEGTEGNVQNPAAPAVRPGYSYDHFDYDLGFGITFPSTIKDTDFFNTGEPGTNIGQTSTGQFLFLDLSANVQIGRWGIGATLNGQTYDLDRTTSGAQVSHLRAAFGTGHLLVARWVDDGQVVIGGGFRLSSLAVSNTNPAAGQPGALFNTSGAALEAGLLLRPNDQHFRVGASVRSALTGADVKSAITPDANGDRVIGDPASGNALFLPNQVALPWDVSVGLAVQLGPRPFNPRWYDPDEVLERKRRYLEWRARERERRAAWLVAHAGGDRTALAAKNATEAALDELALERAEQDVHHALKTRYESMKRFHVLVTTSLTIAGPVKDGVGIESFLEQRVNREGEHVKLTPRLAVETEVVPDWVQIRAGSYYEPTRFSSAAASARLHVTGGADLKLFPWTVFGLFEDGTSWRVAGAIDRAARYSAWSVAVGVWH